MKNHKIDNNITSYFNGTEAAWNKSSLLLKIQIYKHCSYLQSIFNQKLFTKDIKNAKQQCLGSVDQESIK
jgi:hypothetical protein